MPPKRKTDQTPPPTDPPSDEYVPPSDSDSSSDNNTDSSSSSSSSSSSEDEPPKKIIRKTPLGKTPPAKTNTPTKKPVTPTQPPPRPIAQITLPGYRPPPPVDSSSSSEDEEGEGIEDSDSSENSTEDGCCDTDEEVDENGNLKDFVVNDSDEEEPPSGSSRGPPKLDELNDMDKLLLQIMFPMFVPRVNTNRKDTPSNPPNEDEDSAQRGKRKRPSGGKVAPPIKRTRVDIDESINTIDDLLAIVDKYEDKPELEYTINITLLRQLKEPLLELKNLVGLQTIKKQVLDQIMYLLTYKGDPDQMLHTAIYGSAGSGKTTVAMILAKIYRALGYSNGKFRAVKASELIAGYVGQTAIKTQKVIDEARGGVLFIDEAYSLASGKNDSDGFSKEAIDCLNQNLTERKTEFICIIAGYKQQMEECFFSFNPGLNRRFPFRYHIENYTLEELFKIFHVRIVQSGWTIDVIPMELFKKHETYLTQKGGDMENLSQLAKLAYSRRTFGKHQDPPKHLTLQDMQEAFKLFLNSDEVRNRPKNIDTNSHFENHIRPTLYI